MNYRPPRTVEELDAQGLKALVKRLWHPRLEEQVLEAALESVQARLAEHQRQVHCIDLQLEAPPRTAGYEGWRREQLYLRNAWARRIPELERQIAAIQEALVPLRQHAELERLAAEVENLNHRIDTREFGYWLGFQATSEMVEEDQARRNQLDESLKRAAELRALLEQSEVGRRLLVEIPVELDHDAE